MFAWTTGKKKKKSDASDHAMAGSKHRSISDHDSSEPSVSRSTTSTGSIHFGHTTPYTSTVGTSFKEAEYSGRLLLHGLRLTEFPVEALTNNELLDVVFIDMKDNRLSTLPVDFASFDCLISCIISSNRFRTIPTCICSLEHLTYLDFSFNEISHLPDGLFDLPLETLILAGNKISFIPESIKRLAPTLVYLDLSRNELKTLQLHLKYLKSLKVLKASRNRIEDIPQELCTKLELRTLDLSQNSISFLPNDMTKMKELRVLNMACNPLKNPPLEIIERGIVHIFKWLDGRTSGSSSSGSHDCMERKRSSLSNNNETRHGRELSEPIKSYSSRMENGTSHQIHRPKDIVESKSTTVHSKPHNVQIVHNKVSSVSSHLPVHAGKENSSRQNSPDEQNNNSKSNLNQHSSPGLTKKPISKVAPMVKGTVRPITTVPVNGNAASKTTSTTRRLTNTTQNGGGISKNIPISTTKREVPVKNDTATRRVIPTTIKKTEEPSGIKNVSKTITASTMTLNRNVSRPTMLSDVDNARKLMREKLGPTFAASKGDLSFSQQLADGAELCKFINKIQPNAISPADLTSSANRSKLNVEKFIQFCRKTGVPEATLCSPLDILSKRNPMKVARTILSVAKLQQLQVSPTSSIQC